MLPTFKSIECEWFAGSDSVKNILQIKIINAKEKYTFSQTLVDEMLFVLEHLLTLQNLAAVILTGSDKFFCSGGDLHTMQNPAQGMFAGTPEQIAEKYQSGIQKVIYQIYHLPVPTIAAINGAAIGAGLGLALACDMRFTVPSAKLAESFTRIGLIAGDGDGWLLPRLVGYAHAAYLTFTSDAIDAQFAKQIGLVNAIYSEEELLEQTLQVAKQIANHPVEAVRAMKKLLQQSEQQTFQQSLQAAAEVQGHLHHSEAHQTKVKELIQKLKK